MANHKSAEKRAKQNKVIRNTNRSKKSKSRTFIKRLRSAIEQSNKDEAQKLLPIVQKLLGKLSKTSAMKKQTAARKTSRLAKQVNAL